jgi:hypothetical protein
MVQGPAPVSLKVRLDDEPHFPKGATGNVPFRASVH